MTTTQEIGFPSPWISIWLSPRRTIERILAANPRRFVWLLAALGAITGFYVQFLSFGFVDLLAGWPGWLGLIAGGAVTGVLLLYLNALILHWLGGLIGGRASTLELRAVLAWSALPTIIGVVIALWLDALARALGDAGPIPPPVLSVLSPTIIAVCALWSFIVLLAMLSRVEGFGIGRAIVAYIGVLLVLLSIAMLIRTFLFQPFKFSGGSMTPAVLDGDMPFVSKYAYGYTHFSIPFSPPLFSGRILGSEPTRGDVVVFRLPKDPLTDYIDRVVGMPGDRIQMRQGLLYINDVAVKREKLEDFVGDACRTGAAVKVKRWRETLPNGVSLETLDCVENGFYDNTPVYTVPAGHYFMLGDNRDNSSDSRVLSAVGYVPLENIVGRAAMIFFSRVSVPKGTASMSRPERVGLMVR